VALRERLLATVPDRYRLSRRAWYILAGLAGALVVLAILVTRGTLTRIDQYSLDHLMPWLDPSQAVHNSSSGYWRPFPLDVSLGAKLLDVLTYPCSLLLSAIVVAAAAAVLRRRGLHVTALLPVAAWTVGNAVEWAGKHTLTRPALYGSANGVRIHVGSFDDSFPSGHMLRGIVVAYALTLLLRRSWLPGALTIWVASVGIALVVQSAHTPSDVVGGAIIGLMLVVAMREAAGAEPAR
jgi:membrane-associated phospholipid phosphatase